MTHQMVGDRVKATSKGSIEGVIDYVYSDGSYRVLDGEGVMRFVDKDLYDVKRAEPPLQAGDVVLFYGDPRIRRENGTWVDHSGTEVASSDYVYTDVADKSAVRFLVRGGKVVA